jgi:4-amino-4-deoxy-L-arabinose transferase-like glycosyltransferase
MIHRPIIIVVVIYLFFSWAMIDVYPPPRTDEMLFAPAAKSFIEKGRLETPAFFGMEQTTVWQPPLYFILLGIYFKVVGYSFLMLRVFSIIFTAGSLLLLYLISKKLEFSTRLIFLCLIFLVVDPFFLRFTKIGRMDAQCLFFIISTLYAHVTWLKTSRSIWHLVAIMSGVFATLTHPIGIIAPAALLIHRLMLYRQRQCSLRFAIAPILLAMISLLVIVAAYWIQSPSEFFTQLSFQFGRKTGRGIVTSVFNWLERYRALPCVVVVVFISQMAVVITALRKGWDEAESAVIIFSVLSFVVVIAAYELFYPIYYIPFVAVSVGLLLRKLEDSQLARWKKKFAMTIMALAVVNSILFNLYFVYLYHVKLKQETSITSFSIEIGKSIPQGSSVLLIGDPCLYWEYYHHRKDLRLYAGGIDSLREMALSQSVDIVVVSRGFQTAYDEFIDDEMRYWKRVFSRTQRRFDFLVSVGTEKPYAYRGSVYKIVRE